MKVLGKVLSGAAVVVGVTDPIPLEGRRKRPTRCAVGRWSRTCSCSAYDRDMCRNITTLRGLEPLATPDEIAAASRQFVRKISGVQKTTAATEAAFERAVFTITQASAELLRDLPPRRQPPPSLPPLRRMALAKAVTASVASPTEGLRSEPSERVSPRRW